MKALLRLSVIYKPYRGKLIFSQILLMISALASIASATLMQSLIDNGIQAQNGEVILRTSLWMILLAVIAGLTLSGTAYYAVFFAQGTAWYIRTRLYEKIQEFSFENFDRLRTGNLLVRLNADVQYVSNAIMYAVLLLLYAPFMFLVAFVMAWIDTPSLIWLLFVTTFVVLGLMALIVPRIFKAYEDRQDRLDDLNNTMQENLSGMRVVKAFVREELEVEKFNLRADAMRHPAFQAAFMVMFLNPVLQAIGQLARTVSIWVGGDQILVGGALEIGGLISFTQYLSMIVTPLALLAIVVPLLLRGENSAQRLFEVYDAVPAIQDQPETKSVDIEQVKGRLVFEDVSFAFRRPDGELDPPALKNINLTIEPGEQVGFLGATGAGKTALVNLVPRFYDVTGGRITIDGVDIRDFAQEDLRKIVGIALQEAVLFQGDIRFNLKFGNPETDDENMQEAAKAADAYGFVANLPEKWEAPVARRGYNFSGGQRQRLSLSRTLTTNPKILILDDSTSALDAATESRVQGRIPDFTHQATTIYVAQRISAVIDLDRIYLLQYGEIVDSGTHEELMQRSQLYQEIYESQLGAGITAGLEIEL
ncbi:MAG: ABC transporter ATP-binding protein [Anaerolineales bacterium]|jgi:ATP-binding cassette subfamily B protein